MSLAISVCVARSVSSLLVFPAEIRHCLCFFLVSAEYLHCLCFVFLLRPAQQRARSFCTHQRPRITKSAVLKHIHHKDRRQLQLSRRRWLHACTAGYERYRSRHIFRRGHSLRGTGQCQRLNTCRSRPVRARCKRCRCYIVFVLVLHSHPKSISSRLLPLPQAARDGASLVSSVKTKHISWSSLSG